MAIKENVLPLAQDSGSGYIRTVSSGGASQRTAFDTVKGAITADMDEAIADEVDAREAADTQLQTEIDGKVDKVTGKGLSTNDFTNALKTKLDGIEAGAEVNIIETVKVNGTALVPDANRAVNVPAPTVDSALSTTSENPVQNKIITGAINDVQADVDQNAEDISDLKEDYSGLVNDTGAHINYLYPVFESGSVDVSNYELSYIDSTTICRLIEDNYIVTARNTIIHLNDQNNFAYRCYYSGTDGKWYSGGNWTTSDSVVPNNYRRYVVVVRKTNWGTLTASECNKILSFIYPYTKLIMEDDSYYKTFALNSVLKYEGRMSNLYGLAYSSTTGKISDFIPVKAGQIIYYDLNNESGGAIITLYDMHKNYVTFVPTGNGQYTVPSDGFVRFCNSNDYVNGYAYFDGAIPTKIDIELDKIRKTLVSDVTGTDYMQTAITRITGQLKGKSDMGNLVVFGFNTDQHIKDENDTTYTLPVLRGLTALSTLTREYPYDFIVLGGDACEAGSYATTLNLILDECITVQEPLYDAWCPVVPLTGNHDAAQNNANITGSMLFNAHFKRVANSKFLEGWDNTHTNGYWDSESHGIRFIFFDDTLRNDYTSAQRSSALSAMLESTPNNYKVVIFSHHVLSSDLTNSHWQNPLGLQSIINPYANKIICCICGHSHSDISEVGNGILYIATTLAGYWHDQDGNRGTLNTETETAFDNFVIDQNQQKIYAFRYGHGSDRNWTYTLT